MTLVQQTEKTESSFCNNTTHYLQLFMVNNYDKGYLSSTFSQQYKESCALSFK